VNERVRAANTNTSTGHPKPPSLPTETPEPATLARLQRQAGNRAVVKLVDRSKAARDVPTSLRAAALQRTIDRAVIRRHGAAALEAQLEAAELEEEEQPVQRSVDRAGSLPRLLQRHPMARDRQFSAGAAPSDAKVNALKSLVDTEMPRIVTQMKTTLQGRADPGHLNSLTAKVCQKDDAHNVGLSSPAAANDNGFVFMLRSPYYYGENGDPDEEFVKATLIHETLHFLSYAHTGLQNVEYETGPGTTVSIGEGATPKDSLDEAMTERVSQELYEILYPRSPYKTNYWQSLREIGVHLTAQGLKNATHVARKFQERNWTGGLADLVEKEGLLTKKQLDDLYLRGEAAIADPAVVSAFKANYDRILKLWHKSKKTAWQDELPKGVMPAGDWVKLVNDMLEWTSSTGMPEPMALDLIAERSGGHQLVAKDDPRSHVYGAATAGAFDDDFTILKKYYKDSAKANSPQLAASNVGEAWKGSKVGYDRGSNTYSSDMVRQAVKDIGGRLNLKTFPHVVVPAATTKGATPFKDYEASAFFPPVSPIKNKSMAEVSGVEEGANVRQVIEGKGGGAYETAGQIIYANSLEQRTLLHELGHFKQDIGGGQDQFNENNINFKLLEYHNIVMYENAAEVTKRDADKWVRLSYSRKPMVGKLAQWSRTLQNYDPAEPEQFVLLKQLATPKERTAIAQIEAALAAQANTIYTPKMASFLKRELAAEYFSASKYAQF